MKVNITYNEELDGIELGFEPKPKKNITDFIKSIGFIFNRSKAIWHITNTERNDGFAHQLKSLLENDKPLSEFKISPAFEPSHENINHKNFSYISFYFRQNGNPKWKNYVLFEPSKKIATFLATRYAKEKYGDDIISIHVAERNYMRKARVLLDNGDVLLSETNKIDSNNINRFQGKDFEVIRKVQEITPLYHGTCVPFERFDKQFLGSVSGDIPSFLGYHFTPNEDLAKLIFANEPHKDNFESCRAFEVGIKVKKSLKTTESALVKDILRWGTEKEVISKKYKNPILNAIKEAPYYQDTEASIYRLIFSPSWNDDDGKPYVNSEILAIRYLNEVLKPLGIDSIQYLNEIEKPEEKRYDWIIFHESQIIYKDVTHIGKREKETVSKQPVKEIQLTTEGNSREPDYNKGERFHLWKAANLYIKKLVGKVSDVYYKITWKDNETMEGAVDLEPSDDFKGKNNILSVWVSTFLTNVSKATPSELASKENIDRAKMLIDGYSTEDTDFFDTVLTPKKKRDILKEFDKFHEERKAEFPEVKLNENEIQIQFYGWLRNNYPELLYHKDSIWSEYKGEPEIPKNQQKKLTNEHGVYTKESAGENFEAIEIPFPKSAKYKATIEIIKDEEGNYLYGGLIAKQFGSFSGGSLYSKKERYPTRKNALEVALNQLHITISKQIQNRDTILNNEERKNKMLNSALKALEKFAIDNHLEPEFLMASETTTKKTSTKVNLRKVVDEAIGELTDIGIDLDGEEETIIATTRMDLDEALDERLDENFTAKLKEAIQSFRDWYMDISDNKLRKASIASMHKIIEALGESPIEDLVDTPATPVKKTTPKKKKNQHQINKEIEGFIDNMSGNEVYSDDIKNFLSQYTGSGGLIKQGAEGKGILYEYFTSDEIVKKMWGLSNKYGEPIEDVLEPSCGIGNFIKYAPIQSKVVGYETNIYSAKIAEILYPKAIIHNRSFESIFFKGNIHLKNDFGGVKYDLVIGNPPYGTFSGKYAGMGEKNFTNAIEYDQYFITRSLDLLRHEGILVFIIPSSFLDNGAKYNKIKEKIFAKADLIDAYRLPQKAFDTTDIGTDIIVLKKK